MSKVTPPTDEDDVADLPPLDGEADEGLETEAELEIGAESDASLDDGTGPDDVSDSEVLDVDESERSWLNEEPDCTDLDLGDAGLLDLGAEGSFCAESDELDGPDDGGQKDESPELGELDSGDEGPVAPDDELREEDLPALDADAEGELEDAAFMDDHFVSEEPLGLGWAARPWARVGAPLDLVFATAVACVPRGALVASHGESGVPELSRVDLEGSREVLAAGGMAEAQFSSLAAQGPRIAGVLGDGRFVVSDDGGSSFETCAICIADALFGSRSLWVRTASGRLLVSCDGGRSFDSCQVPGTVAAVARDGSSGVVALVVGEGHQPVMLLRAAADARSVAREPVVAPRTKAPALMAARSGSIAWSGPSGVTRRIAAGPWRSFAWEGRVTALTFVDDDGTLVAATYSATEDTTGLVCLDPAGRVSVVARVGASPRQDPARAGDGRVVALACDDARGVVWTVGDFGVAAFAIAPPVAGSGERR